MPFLRNKNCYIFIDESGKPEIFSAKKENLVSKGQATKFLVLSAVRTYDQLKLQQNITDFKSQLLKDKGLVGIFSPSYSMDTLHANNDYPEVRKRFYQHINSLEISVDVVVVDKLKCFEPLQNDPSKLYGFMSGQLIKNICHKADKTEIIFSRKDSKLKLRQELEIEAERIRLSYAGKKDYIKECEIKYYHNPHYTHSGLQIADYIAYAVFQVFEKGSMEYYEIIRKKIGLISDVCNKKYFTQSNPLKLST